MYYWLLKNVLVGPFLRLAFRPWTRGTEHVPAEGGAILASNHLAVIDSFVLPVTISRKVQFLGKSDYFTGSGVKGRFVAGFMRAAGTVPVDRSGGRASEAALLTGKQILGDGDLLGIYPEGTRSPDGRLYRAKTGVARLAIETGVPVIPVAMVGTDVAQPVGRAVPKPLKVGVIYGEPLDFSRYQGMEGDRFILRSVADEIVAAILKLSGQEYVDIYAATAKARIAQGYAVDGDRDGGVEVDAPGPIDVPHDTEPPRDATDQRDAPAEGVAPQ